MEITFGSVLEEVAPFVGKGGSCPDSDLTRRFALRVLEHLIHKGGSGTLGVWCFYSHDGCVVLPRDLEVPIRIKIDDIPEPVYSKWYEFSEAATFADSRYVNLAEDAMPCFTVRSLPRDGAFVAASSVEPEEGATVIIQGPGLDGQPIFTQHKGERINGELLELGTDEKPTHTRNVFTAITGHQWTKTKSAKRLYWYENGSARAGILAEVRPNETNPRYRKFRLSGCGSSGFHKISILGRVRLLSDYYANEIIPLTSMNVIVEVAQFLQAKGTEKIQLAQFRGQEVERVVEDENEYKKFGQEQPIEWIHALSPGSLRKVI